MKRPERKPLCKGCDQLHSRDSIIETGFEAPGICKGCGGYVLFNYVGKGMYRPQPHPPKKLRRSTGLPKPRGGERRFYR